MMKKHGMIGGSVDMAPAPMPMAPMPAAPMAAPGMKKGGKVGCYAKGGKVKKMAAGGAAKLRLGVAKAPEGKPSKPFMPKASSKMTKGKTKG